MKRRSHDRPVETSQHTGKRRSATSRVLTLGTLAMVAMIVLSACGPNVDKPYSTTTPASPTADDVQSLYKLVFWLALVVFVGVQFAIVYTALRFRKTKRSATRPPLVHGNKRLEIIWTIIPAVVLLAVLIPTITTLYDHDAAAEDGDVVIDVYGKQWWWEVHYGEDKSRNGESLGVITANEIHLPEGKEAVIRLHSNNVIHSFWVPRLSGKMDVIPGHTNKVSITPQESGDFFGECAEFCGTEHAWMRFKIVVQPEDQFYTWVNAQKTGNPSSLDPANPDGLAKAPAAFSVCLSCHTVNGLAESQYGVNGLDAPFTFGPDLTNLACRDSLGGGILANNRENLESWVNNPGGVKPGNAMSTVITPGYIRAQLGDDEFNNLIDYLMSLKPAAGCEATDPGATPIASPVASPVGSPTGSPVASPVGGG